MKIKKFKAADSHTALRMIRDEMGSDVSILTSYGVPEGVEYVVAVDWPQTAAQAQSQVQPAPMQASDAGSSASLLAGRPVEARVSAQPFTPPMASAQSVMTTAQPLSADMPRQQIDTQRLVWDQERELLSLKQELGSMRHLLERHLQGLSRDQLMASDEQARDLLRQQRIAALPTISLEQGVVAVVGAGGIGRSTLIQRLAIRHIRQAGCDQVGIISCTTDGLGVRESQQALSAILQIPVLAADSPVAVLHALQQLSSRSLILIDMPAVSHRDPVGLARAKALLQSLPNVRVLLALAADADPALQSLRIQAWDDQQPDAVALTRVDEAAQLDGLLTLLATRRLPVAWAGDSARLTDPLLPADAATLIDRAMALTPVEPALRAAETQRQAQPQYAF